MESILLGYLHRTIRHFLGEDEIVKFSDSDHIAISNQWGKGTIHKFIRQAKNLGYEIEEAS